MGAACSEFRRRGEFWQTSNRCPSTSAPPAQMNSSIGWGKRSASILRRMEDRMARKANAQVSGGGGGAWKATSDKAQANRAKLTRAMNTQEWVKEKIEEGNIPGGL